MGNIHDHNKSIITVSLMKRKNYRISLPYSNYQTFNHRNIIVKLYKTAFHVLHFYFVLRVNCCLNDRNQFMISKQREIKQVIPLSFMLGSKI